MKKYFFTIIILFYTFSILAQDYGGKPAEGVTSIKRNENSILETKKSNPTSSVNISRTANSNEVGITEGQLAVSLSGAATYAIPIALPPGINGVLPQVGLSYSSQSNNGSAGLGWNISGVSAISRIPATRFHDGAIDAIDFNSLDRFAFDGQRLIVKNGTNGVYGANGTVYETESFSNVQITSYGVHPNGANYGPAYFIVQYPDGSTAQYGNSTDSITLTDYAINNWQNSQGIRINYAYTISNNTLNLSSIKYGSIGTNPQINEVQFIYKTRLRNEQAYIGGQSFIRNTILSEIKVIGNGIGFRNYVLTHDVTSLGYERLKSITEKTGDNSLSLNPTIFNYDTTQEDITPSTSPISLSVQDINFTNSENVTGDFNGDGKMDFLLYPTTGNDAKKKYWLFSDIQGNTLNIGAEHNVGTFEEIFPISWLGGNATTGYKLMPMQGWNIIKREPTTNVTSFTNYSTGTVSPIYFQDNKDYIFPKFDVNTSLLDYSGASAPNLRTILKKYVCGDFNGDGISDVLVVEQNMSFHVNGEIIIDPDTGDISIGPGYNINYVGQTYLVNLDRRITTNYVSLVGETNMLSGSKLLVGDANGDGKSDLLLFWANYVKVFSLNESNQLQLLWNTNDGFINLSNPIFMGDYNGDGKSDFIMPKGFGNNYAKFLSTGNSFVRSDDVYDIPYTQNFGESCPWIFHMIPTDMDGDGKTDLVHLQSMSCPDANFGKFIVRVYFNKSNNFINSYVYNTGNLTGIAPFALPIFLSPNKPNQSLEIAAISNNVIYGFQSQKSTIEEKLLKQITTGNGVMQSITYSSLDQNDINNDNVFTPSTYTENYPNVDIKVAASFQVVSKVEKVAANYYKRQLYKYYGAVYNIDGLGFLGFRSTMQTNWHDDNTQIISSVSRNDISKRGANIENYSILGITIPSNYSPTTGFISKTTKTYNIVGNIIEPILQPNKVFKLKNTITNYLNGLDGISTETTTIYDVYNNPTQSTTNLKNGTSIEQTTVSNIAYFNQPTGSSYFIGEPTSKDQTVIIYPGQTNQDMSRSEELYAYNNNLLMQVRKRVTNSGVTTGYMQEDNLYDVFGNVTKKTVTAPTSGLAPRITNYEYNPAAPFNGRFLTKSYDIENLATVFSFDTSSGVLLSETNPFGLVTTNTYNKWFNKTKIIDYLGKNQTFTYARSGDNTLITTTGDDGSVVNELFDDMGRKITTSVMDINSNFSNTSYLYDIYDRNYKVSEPYFGTTPAQWSETKFDEYGRIYQNISYTGKTVTITYSGLSTTVNYGLKTKTSVKNAIGNVISLTDTPGGIINYTYFANGNLKTTTFDTATTTILQDEWGRKKELTDPSAGTYRYKYNDFGETTEETVLNIVTGVIKGITTYDINGVGKLNFKTIIGQNGDTTNSKVTHTYDATSKLLIGTRFDDYTGGYYTQYNYGYDSYKRLKQKDESGFLAYYQQVTYYDAFGRSEKALYTAINSSDSKRSDKWIKYTYKNGYQYQIIDDATSKVLRQINTVDARGQLLTANSGPYTQEAHDYDQYGFPYKLHFENPTGPYAGSAFLELPTLFDAQRGNLTSRTNSAFGVIENYTNAYDNLDRLTNYPNDLGTIVNQAYDDKGKITSNNLGAYAYNVPNKPYQVSTVTPANTSVYDYYNNREQNVTYNVFKSPVTITEEGIENIDFQYNATNGRATMYYGGLETDKELRPLRKSYSEDGTMEINTNINTGTVDFITYIGGDGYSAPLVLKSDGNTQNYLYLHRDYQGTILAITSEAGQVLEKRYFDAWGSLTKYENSNGITAVPTSSGLMLLDRGYTGHEHLIGVGLINMNARLYDPKLHRFLQPDNFVQDPSNTQSYNRYGYCVNNPLKYTDQSGEFFSFITAIFDGVANAFTHGVNFNHYDWTRTQNAWKIDMGLFQGNIGQIASRFTFESTQSGGGFVFSGIHNLFGGVKSVSYYGGATAVESYSPTIFQGGGFTLGSYINGREDLLADPSNKLFQHEYGHYLQSQASGILYLSKYAIPSAFDAHYNENHNLSAVEQDANIRAFRYFNENVGEDNFIWNPDNNIKGYNWGRPYNDPSNQLALSNGLMGNGSFLNNFVSFFDNFRGGVLNYYHYKE